MANSEIAVVMGNPDVEDRKEEVPSNNPDSSSKDIKDESAVEDNHESSIWSPKVNKIRKVESFNQNYWIDKGESIQNYWIDKVVSIQNYWIDKVESIQKYWIEIFVASCLCGVLVDPLFLYVPIIKDDVKCLFLDQKLKIAAVILRSVTDLFYILDIVFRIYGSEYYLGFIERLRFLSSRESRFIQRSSVSTIAEAIWESNDILIDIVAILPVPQVVILIFFSNMRELRSLTTRRMFIMNLFALLQYVPRIFRIYLSCSELKKISKYEIKQTPIWIKAILNFSMYIIASHVFGAVWYFFAIQRMMDCWHSACRKEDGCDSSSLGCHGHHTFRNIKILNDLCPINPSNSKMFNLGIFTSVLESGITGSTNYFQKFSNCFWWGLRNLSSLGSNLQPSINGWENLFTASVSIIGLLLFLYLLGNLQMYMQMQMQIQMQIEIAEREKQREKQKEKEREKIKEHYRKLEVKRKAKQFGPKIELWLFKNGIPTKSHKEMESQVMEKMFSGMNELVLKEICQNLKPKKFKKNDIIIEEGKPEKMVFIVDGLVDIKERNSDGSCNNSQRGAGKLCGQDLLLCGSRSNGEYAKAFGYVEALVITAEDMESVRSAFKEQIDAYERYLYVSAMCM